MSQQNKEEPTKIVLRQSWKSFAFGWMIVGLSLIAAAIPGTLLDLYHHYTGLAVTEFFGFPPNLLLLYAGLTTAAFAFSVQIAYPLLANEYLLTDDEIVETFGLIQKRTRITKLAHIRSVNVNITFVGRMLGYGDVFYYTAGSDDVDVTLHNIANPSETADLIKEMTEKAASSEKQRKQEQGDLGGAGTEVLYDVADRIIAAFETIAQAQREQQRGFDSLTCQIRDSLSRIEQSVSSMADSGVARAGTSGGPTPPVLENSSLEHAANSPDTVVNADWSEEDLEEELQEEEPTYRANLDDIIGQQRTMPDENVTPSEPSQKPSRQSSPSVELDLSPGPKRSPRKASGGNDKPTGNNAHHDNVPQVSPVEPPTVDVPPEPAAEPNNTDSRNEDSDPEPSKTPDETWSPALRGVRCEVTGYYTED